MSPGMRTPSIHSVVLYCSDFHVWDRGIFFRLPAYSVGFRGVGLRFVDTMLTRVSDSAPRFHGSRSLLLLELLYMLQCYALAESSHQADRIAASTRSRSASVPTLKMKVSRSSILSSESGPRKRGGRSSGSIGQLSGSWK